MARDGLSDAEARARLTAQWPIEEKAKRANRVIWTDRGFAETDRQITDTYTALLQAI
jgi:dephospho-CoA kinase